MAGGGWGGGKGVVGIRDWRRKLIPPFDCQCHDRKR